MQIAGATSATVDLGDIMGKPARQIVGLDAIRFVAALLVVWYHLGVVAWSKPSIANTIAQVEPFLNPWWSLQWFGFIGVQIFFVISGFVIAYSAENASPFEFLHSRIVRLCPSVWITALVSGAIYLFYNLAPTRDVLGRFLREILFAPFGPYLDVVVWTLWIEISFYAIVFVLLCMRKFAWLPRAAAALAILSLGYQCFIWSMGCVTPVSSVTVCRIIGANASWIDLFLFSHGAFFSLGVFLWLWLIKGAQRGHEWWAALAIPAAALNIAWATNITRFMPWFGAHDASPYGFYAVAMLAWALAIAAIVAATKYNHAISARLGGSGQRVLRLVGLATYPLYLIHYVWAGVFVLALRQFGWSLWPAIWGGVACVLVLSFVIARFVEPVLQSALRGVLARVGVFLERSAPALSFLFARRDNALRRAD